MWGSAIVENDELFTIQPLNLERVAPTERDAFMDYMGVGDRTDVYCAGGASNYCLQDAMTGYLERGCNVYALGDLSFGIVTQSKKPDRAASGDIRDVVQLPQFRAYVEHGKLSILDTEGLISSYSTKEPSPD